MTNAKYHCLNETHAGWAAQLDLEFARCAGRTRLVRRAHAGPLVVQRPFYPEGEICHVYLVHPPGGVVGGDQLYLCARAGPGTHVLLTTPAATKFYRSDGSIARQSQDILVDDAIVEWLPQEAILFPDACAKLMTHVRLHGRSRFIGWEIACYGRPASALDFAAGSVRQDLELWVDDAPVILDRLRLEGRSAAMQGSFGLAGHPVMGTLLAYPADDAMLSAARTAAVEGVSAGCTRVDGALVCRAVAAHTDAVRRLFEEIWAGLRPAIAGRPPLPPRVWKT